MLSVRINTGSVCGASMAIDIEETSLGGITCKFRESARGFDISWVSMGMY